MTIMVKTSLGAQKQPADVMVMPLIDIGEPERPVVRPRKLPATPPRQRQRQRATFRTMAIVSTLALFLTLLGFTSGVLIVTDIIRKYSNSAANLRYRGSCSISSTQDMDYVVLKEAPTTVSWFGMPTTEMRVYSSASDMISSRILYKLLEDMNIEDEIETIVVHDGPRSFKVVHDFNENYTSIISPQRCFITEMIRQFVLEPTSLIASLRNDSTLDISHAHSVFKADLPDVTLMLFGDGMGYPTITKPCMADNKPIYRINLEGTHVLHKRSVEVQTTTEPSTVPPSAEPRVTSELPKNEFVQFSGKHLQRITISNLDDILKYEQDNNVLQAHPKIRAGQASED